MSNNSVSSNDPKTKYFDIVEVKKAFLEGKNITEMLRLQKKIYYNTQEIIEIAYDIQAGTYIQVVDKNRPWLNKYCTQQSKIFASYLTELDTLLDVGTGEMTTLSVLTQYLPVKPKHIFAFDISWSRIYKGLSFAEQNMDECFERLTPFVADIGEVPLRDKSVDVTISNHALEPNGAKLRELMAELFRVTKRKLLLFEPCYEINSDEGKKRMDRLGYIKGLETIVANLGGKVIDKIKLEEVANPLNPTVCFVIEPPLDSKTPQYHVKELFAVPGSNYQLQKIDDFYFSNATGLCFPILKGIPILKSDKAILASSLSV